MNATALGSQRDVDTTNGDEDCYVGHTEQFNPDNESISTYIGRVELYFAASGIEAERNVAVFLTLIGSCRCLCICTQSYSGEDFK